ncbi:MAG: hypothetical protein NVS4B8_06430 [Herpetosiphon sp.]
MSYRAWTYIWTVLLTAAGLGFLAWTQFTPADILWLAFAALVTMATLAQFFRADGFKLVSFYATPVFFFAGVVLLPPFLFVLLVIIPHLLEWIKARWNKQDYLRSWYAQPLNIGIHIIAGMTAKWVYVLLDSYATSMLVPSTVLALLGTVVTYLLVTQVLLGLMLVLARRMTWRTTGVLDVSNLLTEFIMLCLGLTIAVVWHLSPLLILPSLSPLVLMYRSLLVPALQQEARTDAKTTLLNARYFTRLSNEEWERSHRFDRPLAVVMADLDLLRNINNTYGHLAGDTVIAGIGKIIATMVRDFDIAGRFGGEEFAIVLPETRPHEARLIAERIRQAVEGAAFTSESTAVLVRATMSLGVACYPEDGSTLPELIHAADVAVYQAKQQGRNKVVLAGELTAGMSTDAPTVQNTTTPATQPLAVANVDRPVSESRKANGGSLIIPDRSDYDLLPNQRLLEPPLAGVGSLPSEPWIAVMMLLAIGVGIAQAVQATGVRTPTDAMAVLLLAGFASALALVRPARFPISRPSIVIAIPIMAALLSSIFGLSLVCAVIAVVSHLRPARATNRSYGMVVSWAALLIASIPGLLAARYLPAGHVPVLLLQALKALAATGGFFIMQTALAALGRANGSEDSGDDTRFAGYKESSVQYLLLGVAAFCVTITYNAVGTWGIAAVGLPVVLGATLQHFSSTPRQRSSIPDNHTSQTSAAGSSVLQQMPAVNRQHTGDEALAALTYTLPLYDSQTLGRSIKVAEYATALAAELALPSARIKHVRQAAYLHAIGKEAPVEHSLAQAAGAHAIEEPLHASVGGQLLETMPLLSHIAPFVRHHHERWDGQGYPDRLCGDAIPLESRILHVAIAVEGMASGAHSGAPMTVEQIVAEVCRGSGTQFDPTVCAAFVVLAERDGKYLFL